MADLDTCEHGIDMDATCATCEAMLAEAHAVGAVTPNEIGIYEKGRRAGLNLADVRVRGWMRDAAEYRARGVAAAYQRDMAQAQHERATDRRRIVKTLAAQLRISLGWEWDDEPGVLTVAETLEPIAGELADALLAPSAPVAEPIQGDGPSW